MQRRARYLTLMCVVLTAASAVGQDVTAPIVTATDPAHSAEDVPTSLTAVYVHFDEQMDRDSYAENVFLTVGADPGGPRVAVGALHAGGTYCGLALGEDLALDTSYGLHVTTGVADLADNHLEAFFTCTFTTVSTSGVDHDPPFVILTTPLAGAVGVAVDLAAVSIVFNELMDADSLAGAVFLRVGLTANGPTVAVTGLSLVAETCTLELAGPLAPGTVYSLHVATAATDLAGNPLAGPFSGFFRTVAPSEDLAAPFVTSTDPLDGATDVRQDIAVVRVDFNEIMDIDSYAGNIAVTGPGADVADLFVGVSHVSLLLTGALATSTVYGVEVGTGVTDLAGNPLDAVHIVHFTTSDEVPAARATWGGLKAGFR